MFDFGIIRLSSPIYFVILNVMKNLLIYKYLEPEFLELSN
jgi:hypothetical protein